MYIKDLINKKIIEKAASYMNDDFSQINDALLFKRDINFEKYRFLFLLTVNCYNIARKREHLYRNCTGLLNVNRI